MKGHRLAVKVWCLPRDSGEEALQKLFQDILQSLIDFGDIGVHDKDDAIIMFPADLMDWGLGIDIRMEVLGLPDEQKLRLLQYLNILAEKVGGVVSAHLPDATVDCIVTSPYNDQSGFWTSRE
jgi:hypothetical protein